MAPCDQSGAVTGHLSGHALPVTWALAEEPGLRLHRLSLQLSNTPVVSPMKHDRPADVARRLFG
jgi:hypothetical protein